MVFIQGAAHHMDSEGDRASAWASGGQPSGGGTRELFLRITPTYISGRRVVGRRLGGLPADLREGHPSTRKRLRIDRSSHSSTFHRSNCYFVFDLH
jgi:hypothetical protein